jgi:EAL domain-containing protein (putative c-di-GMP-specific phosphodiesterase class I)
VTGALTALMLAPPTLGLAVSAARRPLRLRLREAERRLAGSTSPEAAAAAHRLAAAVDAVLGAGRLWTVFQPIVCLTTGRLVGAEALSRFPSSERTTEQWFTGAADIGRAVELDLAAIRTALDSSHSLPPGIYVSVNVHPRTLVEPALWRLLAASPIDPGRLVLEVTEHASIEDYDAVLLALASLRSLGIRLAVDDAGAGYASFRHVLRLAPEFIKLDRSLVSTIHADRGRRALATAVVAFAAEMGATVVAEGIESLEELDCVEALGIHAAQGYLFGRPAPDLAAWDAWQQYRTTGVGVL